MARRLMGRRALAASAGAVMLAALLSSGGAPRAPVAAPRQVWRRASDLIGDRTASGAAAQVRTVYFYSGALHRETDYLVYLPRGYRRSRPLPVFYMLHGMPGRPLAFTVNADVEPKLEQLIQQHLVRPMILVFPDGRIDYNPHTDSEWANTPAGHYESYIVDVVHDVDARFATLPYRRDRAIAGLSAGAYGAANVGLHQVSLFGLIQVWSGYFTETRTGVFAGATPAELAYNSPIDYVRTMKHALERYPLRMFIYVGNHDRDAPQTPPMAAALKAEGAHVRDAVYPGGHSWKLWAPRVDRMLIMASHDFAPAPAGGSSRRSLAVRRAVLDVELAARSASDEVVARALHAAGG